MWAGLPSRVAWALLASLGAMLAAGEALAQTKTPKLAGKDQKLFQELLAKVHSSSALKNGWFVSGPTYDVHSTISQEYTAMAALHLDKFHRRFTSIFREPFKDARKPMAYGFATEKEYLEFSPGSKDTQGRFLVVADGKGIKKDLAWFAMPPGEKDFYQTDYGVVQHEATHQLLDAYTDNQAIPAWFHEGCASFFESWNLDDENEKNIRSGISGRYGLGICLSYPEQKTAPPLAAYWIPPREVLGLQKFGAPADGPRKWPPGPEEEAADLKRQVTIQQHYSQSWCAMTFLIQNEVGRKVFTLFVGAFREQRDLSHIRSQYYTEDFLSSFEKEWHKFIKKDILKKWDLPTAGGKTLRVGDGRSPPPATEGFPLTDDQRGDLYLIRAEAGQVPEAYKGQKWWLLQAWGVPVQFYKAAWKEVPTLLSRGQAPLIGSAYALVELRGEKASPTKVFILIPVWAPPARGSGFPERVFSAAEKLVAKAKADADTKAKAKAKAMTTKASPASPGKTPRKP